MARRRSYTSRFAQMQREAARAQAAQVRAQAAARREAERARVRDLFGTLQNEGASKGILVTTSGYGQASFEFAQNKPIELIDGANLLYLLNEHAGIEAKIMPPEDWKDPAADAPDRP